MFNAIMLHCSHKRSRGSTSCTWKRFAQMIRECRTRTARCCTVGTSTPAAARPCSSLGTEL
eukprot:6376303-Alexandrium_andersonii.AAC.1